MTICVRNYAARAAGVVVAFGMASQASAATNLIVNGDFSAGNSGFTSEYAYVPQPATPATGRGNPPTSWNETTYGVGSNADLYHSLWSDVPAASGAGDYLIVNGGIVTPLATLWSQTVTVAANTSYDFSALVANVYPTNPATLDFYIDSVLVGSYSATGTGVWGLFSGTWNSGSSTSAVLSIVDTNTIASGNDFGVDSLSLTATVPESSIWAMMALGFLGLGVAGARFRRPPRAIA